ARLFVRPAGQHDDHGLAQLVHRLALAAAPNAGGVDHRQAFGEAGDDLAVEEGLPIGFADPWLVADVPAEEELCDIGVAFTVGANYHLGRCHTAADSSARERQPKCNHSPQDVAPSSPDVANPAAYRGRQDTFSSRQAQAANWTNCPKA